MKKALFLILVVLLCIDNMSIVKAETLVPAPAAAAPVAVPPAPPAPAKAAAAEPVTKCPDCQKMEGWLWFYVLAPILLFILSWVFIIPAPGSFKLKEALRENDLPKKTIMNPEYTIANLQINAQIPATIEVSDTEHPKSSSRYIAYTTSVLTWIIAVCLASYFIYLYLSTGKIPELNKLSDVLIALGIGVVPYSVNRVSEAYQKKQA